VFRVFVPMKNFHGIFPQSIWSPEGPCNIKIREKGFLPHRI
jgi:hypothetical protein